MNAISVIMPCHNRAQDLTRILEAYDRQSTAKPFEVIAIDDASTDSTYKVLDAYHPMHFSLRVERLERNQGPATARNRGIALASSPIVVFVGDDIRPESNFVQDHVEAHDHYREMERAILGRVMWPDDLPRNTLMVHIDGIGAQQFSFHYLRNGQTLDFRHLYTSNISLKTAFLRSLDHWFDTDFRYAAFEDVELAYRLAKRGLGIVYSAAIVVRHYHYHTIWTFSSRQYHSGLMAGLLTRKHPYLLIGLKRQYLRIAAVAMSSLLNLRPLSDGALQWLEATTLHLASFYEWTPNCLLDRFYLTLLDYFYYKGLIENIFGTTPLAVRIHKAHAGRYLVPLLVWFLKESTHHNIPVPDGYGPHMLNQIS